MHKITFLLNKCQNEIILCIKMQENSLFEDMDTQPLASRLRPENLDEFTGQEHIIGKGKILRNIIESDKICSMIFWGPPGVGKTTLAQIISKLTCSKFINFSAVTSGIKEIKAVMQEAQENRRIGEKTILFVDEIHRFNKSQQDAFLPFVERGSIILIGATTENPSFEVNSALLSRCKVFVFKPLEIKDIVSLLRRAVNDKRGYGQSNVKIGDDKLEVLAKSANGDARSALSTLEMLILNSPKDADGSINVTDDILEQCISKKSLMYDKNGEEHYNIISALHKSMRNSDADAAVYWLARMLEAGEDPLYIARRIIRFASEDIGLADPRAMEQAVSCYQACHYIGMPECSTSLAQTVIYMSISPKSNAVYTAYKDAQKDALESLAEPVPMNIRNAPTRLMKEQGYGKGYIYAHDTAEKLSSMQCLPDNLISREYYKPTEQGVEAKYKSRLEQIKAWKKENS